MKQWICSSNWNWWVYARRVVYFLL